MTTATLDRPRTDAPGLDGIPADVARIRIACGFNAGTFARSPAEGWARIDGDGRMTCSTADRHYRDGRVAIPPAPPLPPVAEPRGTCSLRLTIDGSSYTVRPIDPGFAGSRAFRLRKGDATYDVVQAADLIRCDCPDYVFRRDGRTDCPCKHGAALVALGLLDDPGR